MEYRILGPLEVAEQDREILLGGGRQRSLLALLLLHPNEVLSSEHLIDELWGEAPPTTAAKTVQVYVSQLRKALRNGEPDGPILTRGRGYVLRVAPGELDRERFERALEAGRRALDREAPDEAADTLRAALALWRGPPLADFAYEPFAQAEIARLEELRLAAFEERVEADLELGRHAEVVGELEALVAEHPLRERLREQLMLALYRCDRQAEALQAYRDGRERLIGELGLEPCPSLRAMQQRILAQDPALGAPPRVRRGPRPSPATGAPTAPRGRLALARRPRALIAAGTLLVAAAVAVAALQVLRGAPAPVRPAVPITYSALAAIAPSSGAVDTAVSVPGANRVAVADGLVWVGADDSNTVSAIDTRTRRLVRTVPVGLFPTEIAGGGGSVWVLDGGRGRLARIDGTYGRILDTLRVAPPGLGADRFEQEPLSLAVGAGGVWVTDGSDRLLRVDPETTTVAASIPTGRSLVGVAVGAGAVWAISGEAAQLLRIDPRTSLVTNRIDIVDDPRLTSPFPIAVAAAGGAVWVLNANTSSVTRIDARARGVVTTIPIGVERAPGRLAADEREAWVANEDGTLTRIDAATNEIATFPVGRMLRDVAVGGGAVWTTNQLGDCCGQEQ